MKLLLEGIGALLAIAFTLYCFGVVFANVVEFLLLPIRLLVILFG